MRTRLKTFCLLLSLAGAAWGVGRTLAVPILSSYTFSREVLDRDGRLLRLKLSGDEKYRIYVPLAQIEPKLVDAVLLHEDRHFRSHPGINPFALGRAVLSTYGGGPRRIGGSTITMQLARMTSTTPSKTLVGKVVQISRALALELFHSKDEILEAYLNLLPYGANIEGVGAASLIYFNKPASELLLPESLTLAVIPQNPNARRVVSGDLTESSLARARKKLFDSWLEVHPGDAGAALDFRIGLETRKVKALPFLAPHFTDLALARSAGPDFRKNGLVKTTLDRAVQETIERKVKAYVTAKSELGIRNAAVLVLNHETMEVEALVGSADFTDDSIQGQVNGTLAKRSPGSTLKPFAYALALDQGLIHPLSLLKDAPMSFSGFDPENYDRTFAGPLTATDALVKSRNVPAVYVTSLLKSPTLYDFMKDGGITKLRDPVYYGLSLPLGGAEVTMEELVRLYAMLANRGELRELNYLLPKPKDWRERPLNGDSTPKTHTTPFARGLFSRARYAHAKSAHHHAWARRLAPRLGARSLENRNLAWLPRRLDRWGRWPLRRRRLARKF
jgi:penicillin-binding protein 1C